MTQINLSLKKESCRCRKQIYGYQGVEGEGINWEIRMDIYTLLYIKQIRTYCTAPGTQYSVMACMEKETYKREIYTHTLTTDSFYCTRETNTTTPIKFSKNKNDKNSYNIKNKQKYEN